MQYRFENRQVKEIGSGDPNTLVSSIDVSGLEGRISDVNVQVDVDHTFTSDLEIALVGPTGTHVVLVSGAGGDQENFLNTLFDDEALQPVTTATAPFTGTFQPEEGLRQFDQLDANGEWQLEVTDTVFKDGGQLKSWFLEIEVEEHDTDTLYFESTHPVVIDEALPVTVSSAIIVTGHADLSVEGIDVELSIHHTFDEDLRIVLVGPTGHEVLLSGHRGGDDDDYIATTFSDSADLAIGDGAAPFTGRYQPEEALAAFAGKPVNGAWTLVIEDTAWQDGGELQHWSLRVKTQQPQAPVESAFKIHIEFQGGLTATQQAVFQDAADRWQQIIVGELPPVNHDGTIIEGVRIAAKGGSIDGVGGILGQAGPHYLRDDSGLPIVGGMEFDTADLADMEADGSLVDVIVHEMGHVLGIGTLWNYQNLVLGSGTSNPTFSGSRTKGEYEQLRGVTDNEPVPLANTGGPGTAEGHWREASFDVELMTGYIDAGIENPISRMTIASLEDLGYEVSYASADNYVLPTPGGPALRRSLRRKRQCCTTSIATQALRSLTVGEVQFMEMLSWNLGFASTSGISLGASGKVDVDMLSTMSFEIVANMIDQQDLDLQLDDVDKLSVFAVLSTLYDGTVEIQGKEAGRKISLTGPLVLFGDAIKNFSTSLDKLKVQNKHASESAVLRILIGRSVR